MTLTTTTPAAVTTTTTTSITACYKREPGMCSWHNGETMGWVSEELWFDSQQRQEIFLYSEMSNVAGSPSLLLSSFWLLFP